MVTILVDDDIDDDGMKAVTTSIVICVYINSFARLLQHQLSHFHLVPITINCLLFFRCLMRAFPQKKICVITASYKLCEEQLRPRSDELYSLLARTFSVTTVKRKDTINDTAFTEFSKFNTFPCRLQ